MNPEVRYDRQVRLWGEEGQASIGSTTVCLLKSDSLGTEILKSLVLAGIHSFFIIDDAKVIEADVGQNFFLHVEDIGRFRAEATLEKLKELNPSVSGKCSTVSPSKLSADDLNGFSQFSVVVSSNLSDGLETSIAAVLYEMGVPLICAKSYGMIGVIKVCIKEHTIANNHDENPIPDLRLDVPFEKLKNLVDEVDWDGMSIADLKHTPYILLLFKALEIFRKKREDPTAFPSVYAERREIKSILSTMQKSSEESGIVDSENFDEAKKASIRTFQKTVVPPKVAEILKDAKFKTSTQPFWLICEALRRFVEKYETLPVRGTLPDMTSDSARYTRLATIFHEKAAADAKEVFGFIRDVEKERGVSDVICEEMCYRFCKNADRIRVQRGDVLDYNAEVRKLVTIIGDLPIFEEESKSVDCSIWLLLIRAVDRFCNEKGRYPGTNGVPCKIDAFDLKQRVDSIVKNAEAENADKIISRIPTDVISEMCRVGAAELHVISSLIGGIAAQEVIKLATNQYVPLDNTFVFDGITQQSQTFKI